MTAITFDFGQTLAELDHEFLQRRLAERGIELDVPASRAALTRAWNVYGAAKDEGHGAAWAKMMSVLLVGGGVPEARARELADWLFREQPRQNLWRQPIPGMIELCAELRQRGAKVAIISNSEGKLAELVAELGWTHHFAPVVDSGRVGFDKPDPRIFQHACALLEVEPAELVHVGDSWEADVEGARAVGARAVWFAAGSERDPLPPNVERAANAAEVRAALDRLGALPR